MIAWQSIRHNIVLAGVVLLVSACASKTRWDHTPRQEHIVRSGETLFSIAWRYGKEPADLARWNDIGDGSLIYPGQVIRLNPPSANAAQQSTRNPSSGGGSASQSSAALPPIPTAAAPAWRWPAAGNVATEFGSRPGSGTGLLIAGSLGDPVRAAASGRVVYAGSGLIGYGKLIILKHNDTYLSAYGYNQALLVEEGDAIKKGQRIATLGEGPGREPRLHFEIRRNGEPVNPRRYLPAR
jgi:lipoprotein NlpD